jgi:hypothetical protein
MTAPLKLRALIPIVDRGVELHLSPPDSRTYAIQASSDFLRWSELGVVAGSNGTSSFLDRRASVTDWDWVWPPVNPPPPPDPHLPPDQFVPPNPIIRPPVPVHFPGKTNLNPALRFYRLVDLSKPETITGTVSYYWTGAPIQGATISALGQSGSAESDSLGRFTFTTTPLPGTRLARVFFAEAPGYIRGFCQPVYDAAGGKLSFRLEKGSDGPFPIGPLGGRTFLTYPYEGNPQGQISFLNATEMFPGKNYLSFNASSSVGILELSSEGIFPMGALGFDSPGVGWFSKQGWNNALAGDELGVSSPMIEITSLIHPPAGLHDQWMEFRVKGQYYGTLKFHGGNMGSVAAWFPWLLWNETNSASYVYRRDGDFGVLSVTSSAIPDFPKGEFKLAFTSDSKGRFLYSDYEHYAYAGTFEHFVSLASSCTLHLDLEWYDPPFSWPLAYDLILSDGGEFFIKRGGQGGYSLSKSKDNAHLVLTYTPVSDGEDVLDLTFTTATSGTVTGFMTFLGQDGPETVEVGGTFRDFTAPRQ